MLCHPPDALHVLESLGIDISLEKVRLTCFLQHESAQIPQRRLEAPFSELLGNHSGFSHGFAIALWANAPSPSGAVVACSEQDWAGQIGILEFWFRGPRTVARIKLDLYVSVFYSCIIDYHTLSSLK